MSNAYFNQVKLDPDELSDKESMTRYLKERIPLPEWFGSNLDALADALSEISEETVFEVDADTLDAFSQDSYPKKVLHVISAACEENPHLHLYLTDSDHLENND